MRPLIRTGLAALALAAAATPVLAQTYGGQGYGGQGYGGQAPSGQGYDRQAYPPSTYDRGAQPSSGYGRGGSTSSGYDGGRSQPTGGGAYDQGGADDGAQDGGQGDPQELARRLNLSAQQQGAFDAYRRAFQPDEARMRREEDEMRRMASLTTPQRLDLARAAQVRDRADFDRTEAATRAFYAQLSAGQRRTFDQLTAPQMDDEGGGADGPSPTQPAGRPPR